MANMMKIIDLFLTKNALSILSHQSLKVELSWQFCDAKIGSMLIQEERERELLVFLIYLPKK